MGSKKILLAIGSLMTLGVTMVMAFAGMNLSRTVDEFAVIAKEDSVQTTNDSVIARTDARVTDWDGVEHVEPLGETKTTGPNTGKIMATAVGVQSMSFGALAICLVIVISLVVKYWRRDRNQVK